MNINIEGDWYLQSDAKNYILAKYQGKDKNGEDVYAAKSFCNTVEGALKAFAERKIRASEAQSFGDLMVVVKEVKALLGTISRKLETV